MSKKKKKYINIKGVKIGKLNFSLMVSTCIMLFLMLVFSIIFFGRKIKANAAENSTSTKTGEQITVDDKASTEIITTKYDNYEEDTTKEIETLEFDADNSNSTGNLTSLNIKVGTANSWADNDGNIFIQYRIRITNITNKKIEKWGMSLHFNKPITILDSWNGIFETEDYNIKINPDSRTYEIDAGDEIEVGVIVETKGYRYPVSYTAYLDNQSRTVNLHFTNNVPTNTPSVTTDNNSSETTSRRVPVTSVNRTEETSSDDENSETTTEIITDVSQDESTSGTESETTTENNTEVTSKTEPVA